MENVISKDSPDDMMVMYKNEEVELLVPIVERAVEIHVGSREFVMGDGQALGFLKSIVALSKEVAEFEKEFANFMKKDRLAYPECTPIRSLRNALTAISMCEKHKGTTIFDPLRLIFKNVYLAASRNTIDTDFRVQPIPKKVLHKPEITS